MSTVEETIQDVIRRLEKIEMVVFPEVADGVSAKPQNVAKKKSVLHLQDRHHWLTDS